MFTLKIAFRYLIAKKSHRAVNVITLVSVVGVAIATMAIVLVLSIFNGFSDLALSQLSNLAPDFSVVPTHGKVVENADSVASVLTDVEGVERAFPIITERGLLDAGSAHLPVVISGVPDGYDEVSRIDNIMLAGEYAYMATDGTPAIQLSVGVANGVSEFPGPDSRLQVIVPRRTGRINPANPAAAFRGHEFAFSGVFRAGNNDIDNDRVIMPLDAARDLLDYDTEATSVDVYIDASASESKVRKSLENALKNDSYSVLDRVEQHSESFRMISVEKWLTFMMLICILVIAMFNIISTLSLLAIEKRDNMRTLRALGAKASTVRNIFVAEGFLVTVLGGGIGIVLGVIFAALQQIFHLIKLSADEATLTINYYPVRIEWPDLLAVAGAIVVLALIISFIARLIVRNR